MSKFSDWYAKINKDNPWSDFNPIITEEGKPYFALGDDLEILDDFSKKNQQSKINCISTFLRNLGRGIPKRNFGFC